MYRLQTFAAFGIIAFFLIYILLSGFEQALIGVLAIFLNIPNFSQYTELRILSHHEFPINEPSRRVIIVGDIHGMILPLRNLLEKIHYVPSRDVLITVGDIVAKAPLNNSLEVLNYLSNLNVTGVRGNHDQKVIEWRGWLNWATSLPGGHHWLRHLEKKWSAATSHDPNINLNVWLKKTRKEDKAKDWWKLVPKGWVPLGDHYQIAKDMTEAQYQYLLQLPLQLYIPHVHAFIIHAGLLPANPRYPLDDERRQPFARVPKGDGQDLDVESLRQLQELGLITQIPQNADPWNIMNMRSILDGKVTKHKKGIFWAEMWRKQMDRCAGFDLGGFTLNRDWEEVKKNHKLPCYPSSAIYGHTASLGLDIHRWTFGLDSGCIYGRSLSALVIDGKEPNTVTGAEDDIDERGTQRSFDFSDNLEARVVSVDC